MVKFWGVLARSSLVATGALVAALWSAQVAAQGSTVRTPAVVTELDQYAINMLQLALGYEGAVNLKAVGSPNHTQSRLIEEVQSGNLDVMWAATDASIESRLHPVRIPLLKGLLGHRVFLIEKDNQARFDKVKTLEDLQQLRFGLGTTWADTKILEAAGFTVVKANKYESLLHMVDGGRFDAFPRGLQEPWAEIAGNPDLALGVESGLMLVYKMAFYVFVSNDNKALAEHIEAGLNRALADGHFDRQFFTDPTISEALARVNLTERRVFHIENSELPKGTPTERSELWLNLDEVPEKLAFYAAGGAVPEAAAAASADAAASLEAAAAESSSGATAEAATAD